MKSQAAVYRADARPLGPAAYVVEWWQSVPTCQRYTAEVWVLFESGTETFAASRFHWGGSDEEFFTRFLTEWASDLIDGRSLEKARERELSVFVETASSSLLATGYSSRLPAECRSGSPMDARLGVRT